VRDVYENLAGAAGIKMGVGGGFGRALLEDR